MLKSLKLPGRHEVIDQTLYNLTARKKVPVIFYFILLALYGLASYFVRKTAGNQDILFIINIIQLISAIFLKILLMMKIPCSLMHMF